MISEESCDTEDCSNDAENTALITGKKYILKYRKQLLLLYLTSFKNINNFCMIVYIHRLYILFFQ